MDHDQKDMASVTFKLFYNDTNLHSKGMTQLKKLFLFFLYA